MLDEMAHFRDKIRQEKQSHTYTYLEDNYGVNRWYLWNIINDDDYTPPERVQTILGIRIYSLAPICPDCQEVPLSKRHRCPSRANSQPHRQPPVRVAELTASERAAVLAQTPAERRRRLLLDEMPEWY